MLTPPITAADLYDAVQAASVAKLYASQAAIQSEMDAMQIHGGYGYMTELEIERAGTKAADAPAS